MKKSATILCFLFFSCFSLFAQNWNSLGSSAVSPTSLFQEGNTIYAATGNDVLESTDNGNSWSSLYASPKQELELLGPYDYFGFFGQNVYFNTHNTVIVEGRKNYIGVAQLFLLSKDRGKVVFDSIGTASSSNKYRARFAGFYEKDADNFIVSISGDIDYFGPFVSHRYSLDGGLTTEDAHLRRLDRIIGWRGDQLITHNYPSIYNAPQPEIRIRNFPDSTVVDSFPLPDNHATKIATAFFLQPNGDIGHAYITDDEPETLVIALKSGSNDWQRSTYDVPFFMSQSTIELVYKDNALFALQNRYYDEKGSGEIWRKDLTNNQGMTKVTPAGNANNLSLHGHAPHLFLTTGTSLVYRSSNNGLSWTAMGPIGNGNAISTYQFVAPAEIWTLSGQELSKFNGQSLWEIRSPDFSDFYTNDRVKHLEKFNGAYYLNMSDGSLQRWDGQAGSSLEEVFPSVRPGTYVNGNSNLLLTEGRLFYTVQTAFPSNGTLYYSSTDGINWKAESEGGIFKMGNRLFVNRTDGLYVSDDNGQSWTKVFDQTVAGLQVNPLDNSWYNIRLDFASKEIVMVRSTDNGNSFTTTFLGMPPASINLNPFGYYSTALPSLFVGDRFVVALKGKLLLKDGWNAYWGVVDLADIPFKFTEDLKIAGTSEVYVFSGAEGSWKIDLDDLFDLLPPLPAEAGLSLTAIGTPANVDAYAYATTTFTLTNHENFPFDNISVDFNIDPGVILQGGNEYTASQGTLASSWTNTPNWEVGSLAAGETASITLNLFTLSDGSIPVYGQVQTATGNDSNSTPGNGLCCTANEDDEAVFTFNGTSPPPPGDPDIINLDLQAPTTLIQGQNYTATYKMANLGSGAATGNFTTRLYLSSDALPDSGDLVLGQSTGSNYAPGFTSATQTVSFTAPSNLPAGNYYLVLSADDDDDVLESNENNNVNGLLLNLEENNSGPGVDVALLFGATSPAAPTQWSLYSETLTISNTGTATATGISVAFAKPNGVTYQGGNEYSASQGTFQIFGNENWEVGTLAPGATATLTVNYFLLIADVPLAYAQVMSLNENDVDSTPGNGTCCTPNEDDEASTGSTAPPTDKPDLTLANLLLTNTAEAGEILDFNFDLSNIGTANAVGSFSIKAYLSTDDQLSVDDIQDGIVPTGNLNAGATISQVPGQSTLPANMASGNYFLILKVDADEQIGESNEGNNLVVASFSISAPPPPVASCAFITRDEPQGTMLLREFLDLSLLEDTNGYTIQYTEQNTSFSNSTTDGKYVLDVDGNVVSVTEGTFPPPTEEVRIEVDANFNVEMVFEVSVNPPSGTRVSIPLNLPNTPVAVYTNQPFKTSAGYAFGVAVVEEITFNLLNFVVLTDKLGNVTRIADIPNPDFYGGFSRLYEGPDGSIFTEWLTSGNFSLYGIPANGGAVWVKRVASDTPSSTWVDTEVSEDGLFVYTAVTDNQRAFITKLDALTGELLGYDLQAFIETNSNGEFRQTNVYGIFPTSDGGLLVGIYYRQFSGNVNGSLIGKLDGNGQIVWIQDIPGDQLFLLPVGETSDGGALFAGVQLNNSSTGGLNENIFIKTTNTGELTPLCGGAPPSNGVDLELSFQNLGDPNPAQWSLFDLALTVVNTGTEAATDVRIAFPRAAEVVYQGGNEYTASQGSFNFYGDENWEVGNLAPGEMATLNVNYFRLGANAFTAYAQVAALNESDVDSAPGNGLCCTAQEDDEASTTIGSSSAPNNRRVLVENIPAGSFAIIKASPNPAMDHLAVQVYAAEAQQSELLMIDALGRPVQRMEVALEKGINIISVDLSEEPAGMKTIMMEPFHPYLRQLRVIKIE